MTENAIMTMGDIEKAAGMMAKSGYFTDSREMAQAAVKIMAGQEMGFGPFASMTGVHIIQGKPSIGANLMAAAVKGRGKYDYQVVELTDQACELSFHQSGTEIGRSRFTLDDAKKAGTKNLDKFPRNMLFARAMSNGVRWYTPDIFNCAPVYTPEELGADVNEDGQVIDIKVIEPDNNKPKPTPRPPEPEPEIELPIMTLDQAIEVVNSRGELYGNLPNDKLTYMANSIHKTIRTDTVPADVMAEYARKLAAIKVILEAREAGLDTASEQKEQ